MKKIIKTIVRGLIDTLPDRICKLFFPIFAKVIDKSELEERVLSRFTDKLLCNKDKVIRNIVSQGKVMVIKNMVWTGSYFSVAVFNNIMGLVIYALYLGYIPIIEINEDNNEFFSWDWYFKQPLEDYCEGLTIKSTKVLDVNHVAFQAKWIYRQSGYEYEKWSYIYQNFGQLNEKTKAYINLENSTLGELNSVLGVLMRGTDYISLKPFGHPVQPELSEVIQASHELIDMKKYRAIYFASDCESYLNAFINEFGKERILSNSRVYYDGLYVPGDQIGNVHFERENDNYKKGLEYLSSMVLLSRCNSLVAGNCGGTKFALLYSKNPYAVCHVFDKGLYS